MAMSTTYPALVLSFTFAPIALARSPLLEDTNVPDRMICSKQDGHDFVGLRRAAWVAAANKGKVNLAQNSWRRNLA